ncbi:MAG: YihY/virulence factor BrkB family protein [Thermomicrobiales bacterium]|jgi:membrane protein
MATESTMAQRPAAMDWRSRDSVKDFGKELYAEIKGDKVTTLAAAFAYYTVFAIPALIILSVTVAALLNDATNVPVVEHLRTFIQDRAPANTKDLLNSIVNNAIAKVGNGASVGAILAALIALWSGSNAIAALIESFNTAYGVEESRPFVRKKGLTIGLTLLLVVFINVAFVLLVFGRNIGHWLADQAGLGSAFNVLWNVARWPVAIAAVMLILAVLYYAGPNVEQSFRWISPGSVAATILWLLATAVVGIYLKFSNPGSAYGVVGSVLVLLFFLYLTGIIFLVGAEINAVLGKRYDPATVQDLATKPTVKPETRARAQERARQVT